MKWFGALLAACRALYCWMFLLWSLGSVYIVFINIRDLVQTQLSNKGPIATSITFAIYSVVFGTAWWMIVRGKPSLERWALAANLILILLYLPIAFWDWRGALTDELNGWPIEVLGIFGILIFNIPYERVRQAH